MNKTIIDIEREIFDELKQRSPAERAALVIRAYCNNIDPGKLTPEIKRRFAEWLFRETPDEAEIQIKLNEGESTEIRLDKVKEDVFFNLFEKIADTER